MNIEEQLKEMNTTLNLIGRSVASLHEKVDNTNARLDTTVTSGEFQRSKLEFTDKLALAKGELLDKLATKEDIRDHEVRIKTLEARAH